MFLRKGHFLLLKDKRQINWKQTRERNAPPLDGRGLGSGEASFTPPDSFSARSFYLHHRRFKKYRTDLIAAKKTNRVRLSQQRGPRKQRKERKIERCCLRSQLRNAMQFQNIHRYLNFFLIVGNIRTNTLLFSQYWFEILCTGRLIILQ